VPTIDVVCGKCLILLKMDVVIGVLERYFY